MLCVIVICHMYTGLEISHHSTCKCPRIQRCQTIGRHNDGDRVTHVSLEVSRASIHSSDVIMGPPDGECLLNRLFSRRSKETSKLRDTGLCEGNSPVTGEFPAQKGQWRGKCFHLMPSSWFLIFFRWPNDGIDMMAEITLNLEAIRMLIAMRSRSSCNLLQ